MEPFNNHEMYLAAFSESLTDMQDYLLRVADGCEQITLLIHTGNTGEAMENLSLIIEGLTYVRTHMETAEMLLKLDYATLCIEKGVTVAVFIKEWERVWHDIAEASLHKDYSLLGDLVDYDLTTIVKQAQKLMAIFEHNVAESKVG